MPVKKILKDLPRRSWSAFLATLKMNDTLQSLSQHFGDNMPPKLSDSELAIPDTKICLAAQQLSEQLNTPIVYKHSIRTYMFGVCIGKHLNELSDLDKEQFYISCVLSKIGLSEQIRDNARDFELIGADYSHSFLLSQNMDSNQCGAIHEAIAMHTSPDSLEYIPQFSLMFKGYILDAIGGYKKSVRQEMIESITTQYSRKDFPKEYRELLLKESNEKPYSGAGSDVCAGLSELMLLNPIDPPGDGPYCDQ